MDNVQQTVADEVVESSEIVNDQIDVVGDGMGESPEGENQSWFKRKLAQFKVWYAKTKVKFNVWMKKYEDFPKPLRRNKYKFIFCMLILSILSWAVFYVYKNISSFVMAFMEFDHYDPALMQDVYNFGFGNFAKFFDEMAHPRPDDNSFKNALLNTLFLYVAGNAIAMPTEYLLSYYLYKKITGYKVFRTVFYLPHILSTVVMVTIFKAVVSGNNNLIVNLWMGANGGPPLNEIGQPDNTHWIFNMLLGPTAHHYARWTVLLYLEWVGLPGSYIVLTAGMNRIPTSVTESAKLDGASAWCEFWHIVVPMIWPTIYILLLGKITGILSADGPILLLTGGASNTYTIGFWFYNQIFLSHSYEYPSAIGMLMTAVVAPISIVARKLLDKVYADVEY